MLRPRNGSGMTSMGGSWRMRPTDVISSGVVSVQSRQALSTSAERSQGKISQPAKTVSSGKSVYSKAVTMPKLPPPPRSAKKRSRWCVWSTRWNSPSAVTSSIAVREFAARPCLRASQPMPPPSV